MLVPSNVGDRVARGQRVTQVRQALVLGRLKAIAFKPFELDANAVVVAIAAASVVRWASVPCPIVATDELPHLASALNQKVR